jgi:hypothetical protein
MKASRALVAILLTSALVGCTPDQRPIVRLLETERFEVEAEAKRLQSEVVRLRNEETSLLRQKVAANEVISKSIADIKSLQKEFTSKTEEFAILRDPRRLTRAQVSKGAKHPELCVGEDTFYDVEVTAFDGVMVSFRHRDGVAKLAAPDHLLPKSETTMMDDEAWKTWKPPTAEHFMVKTYPPVKPPVLAKVRPKVSKPAAKPGPATPGQRLARQKGWPDWFVPVGSNMVGGTIAPLKKSRSR